MCIRFCVNTYFVQVTHSRAVREGRVVDDDLEVSVRAALKAAINERDCLIGRGFLPRGPARLKMNSTLV